nr:helix-turn-helix transcriptional regulator [Proteus sp. G2666]
MRKGSFSDWHRADIVAALHKQGLSLSKLSRLHGLSSRTLNNALERSYPKAERLIAEAIGTSPDVIWPSRYQPKDTVSIEPDNGSHDQRCHRKQKPLKNCQKAVITKNVQRHGNSWL